MHAYMCQVMKNKIKWFAVAKTKRESNVVLETTIFRIRKKLMFAS
jgi:hypothetical protein